MLVLWNPVADCERSLWLDHTLEVVHTLLIGDAFIFCLVSKSIFAKFVGEI